MTLLRRPVLVALVALASCGGAEDPAPGPSNGADTPDAAVTELVAAFDAPDFDSAARLAMPGQAALASLAEGASFGDVAEALRGDGRLVSSNFWSGFAQGAGDYLTTGVAVTAAGSEEVSAVEFQRVVVTLQDGTDRSVFARESDGYRIDLFASFGGGMAARMIQPVERLVITQTDDARLILAELRNVVPSLMVAAQNPDLLPTVRNDLTRLIEVITRTG